MVPSTLLLYLAPAGPVLAAAAIAAWGWAVPRRAAHPHGLPRDGGGAAMSGGLDNRRSIAWVGVAGPAVVLAAAVVLSTEVPETGPVTAAGGLLRADALAVLLLLVVGSVSVVACWASTGYLATHPGGAAHADADADADAGGGGGGGGGGKPEEGQPSGAGGGRAIRYLVLVQMFIATMSVAVLAGNLGVFWVALEATTIFTAFLVGHNRDRRALEAAWKYVVLCSSGIAMAFLGMVVLYAAAVRTGGHGLDALNWTFLTAHAGQLDPDATKLAAGLLVLGFGTKAGLAPVHAWLPDAHSQAPAPVSALMSGVLLSVAFSGIVRAKVIVDAATGAGLVRGLLVAAALLSLLAAATLLLHQRDYKRMLAYSSIEHMGLVALGTAVGTQAAMAAVLLHILGHGLSKAALFCSAGTIMQATGSSRIESVRGLAATQPGLAAVFGFGLLALLGLPPFSLFASELGIARSGFDAGLGWAVAAAAGLLLVVFVAVARHGSRMLLGPSPTDQYSRQIGAQAVGTQAVGTQAVPAQVAREPIPQSVGSLTGRPDLQRRRDGAGTRHESVETQRKNIGTWREVPATEPAAGAAGRHAGPPPAAGRHAGVPLGLALVACAALGVTLGPLQPLLDAAATVGAQ